MPGGATRSCTWRWRSRSPRARTTSSTSAAGSRRRSSGSQSGAPLGGLGRAHRLAGTAAEQLRVGGEALDQLLARGAACVQRAVERAAVDLEDREQDVDGGDRAGAAA